MELEPRRGNIYDRNLKPQAVNLALDSIYTCPTDLDQKIRDRMLKELVPILGVDYENLGEKLSRKKSFVWLARKITPQQSEDIRKLKIKEIGFIKESKRCYPNAYLASHIIGFSGLDNTGLDGIELCFDKYLKGKPGWSMVLRDARQKKLDLSDRMAAPLDGCDLVLTIDEVIQYIAERELDKAFKMYHAKGASIIVMNPYNGQILAFANRPTFDLNVYPKTDKDTRRNRAICDMFEPGSVFKIVTASAALEEKKVNEQDRFYCENGAYRVANHVLHDHEPLGWLTFKQVIEQSSNIGTTKVAQKIGADTVYHYAKLFGFGGKLGFDMPGEISGTIKEPRFWSATSIGAVPIGQEVGVTVLQLACAISAIANGGQLVRPYIVKEIRDKHGESIQKFSPVLLRQVMSPATSERVRKILTGVVEEGTGKLAKVPGFSAGGKTGTAQKLEPNGSYSHNKFVASFIGFAPAEEPEVVIAVVVDDPHPYYYGGVVSAPVFKNVASDVLRYLKATQSVDKVVAFNGTEKNN
ncbi:MAG: penicillin-binding transpeptidase domain-containing protein [Candidatus Omnitrophica bacterium]|nr:penicillin-binding transpeptidase domain-containing protein [Candidatus Omnitrophota bacterium]